MAIYARAEGIIPKFLYFLQQNNALQNYTIDKAVARDMYMMQFKPQYQIVNLSFSKLYQVMFDLRLITYRSFKSNCIEFTKDMFHYSIRIYTKSDLREDSTVTNGTEKKNLKCSVCSKNFASASSLKRHERLEKWQQKQESVSKSPAATSQDVIVEIVDGHGATPETVVLRQKQSKNIVLNILNKSVHNYLVLEFTETNHSSSVVLKKLDLPQATLAAKASGSMELSVMFKESAFYSYNFVFKIKNMTTSAHSDVIKEIIFQVHSQLVDDLHSSRPFKQEPPKSIRNADCEIIPGVAPPSEVTVRYKTKLSPYPLPQDMIVLLDNDFNEFSGITAVEKKKLLHIRNEFSYYKKVGSLDSKNYYSLNQLRLYMEEYQMKIDIHSYDMDNQELLPVKNYDYNCFELNVPGLSEHRPSILRGDSVFIQEHRDSKIKYEGIVHKVNQNSVILGMNYKFADTVYIRKKKYTISFNFNRLPLKAEHQANQLANKHKVLEFFSPKVVIPNPLIFKRFTWYNRAIENNEKQQEAIMHIVSATAHPAPYLIFGPPGTGKTVTVVEAILQIRKLKPDKRILVSAPSNSAADVITKRLIKHAPKRELFRYVSASHPYDLIDVEVKPYTNFKNEFYYPDLSELLNYHIIVTTLVTAFRLVNGGTPPHHFSYVFIDESGQATETETLIPIVGILTSNETPSLINGQIVLAGDPEQLGPVIHSQRANDVGFGVSMLERYMKHCEPYKRVGDSYNSKVLTKLIKSYRSHPDILAQPNQLFYHGDLKPPENQDLVNIAVGWEELPNKNFPIIFHCVQGKDEREESSPSFFNIQEIDVVIQYLEKLIGSRLHGRRIEQSDIGIISPYRKQVFKFQLAFRKKKWDKLSVGSVEQFQGQERLIIIVSTVRSDPKFTAKDAKFHLGFLKNPKRMNVAITRAKALLIVVGNPNLLQLDEFWRSFIKYCKENGAVAGDHFEIFDPSTMENPLPPTNGVTTIIDKENMNFSRGNI